LQFSHQLLKLIFPQKVQNWGKVRVNKFPSKYWISFQMGSQGGQVGYSPDFHPGSLGSTPARDNQQQNELKTT